ncbi:MAG TPA: TraR/DksA C4-type zinc finger protein [Acidimicrobiia bacterium]
MTTIDTTAAKNALVATRAKLVHQLEDMGATETGDLTGDVQYGDGFADAAAATAERTEVLGLVDTLKTQLDAVDAALVRISEGQYGICVHCGKEIEAARLEFRPESISCVDCKSKR